LLGGRDGFRKKYHVALSFAGEDIQYVEKVAAQLAAVGVDVFSLLSGKARYIFE